MVRHYSEVCPCELVDHEAGKAEDAPDDGGLDHVREPSNVGVGARLVIQNGRPTRSLLIIFQEIYLELKKGKLT